MNYLVVVPVAAYPFSRDEFAMESAFCDHLRVLLDKLSPPFDELVIAGFRMSKSAYEENKGHLARVRRGEDRISFVPLCDDGENTVRFWCLSFPLALKNLYRLVQRSDLVHAGTSHDVFRPIEFPALLMGAALKKKTISVTDMDLREDAAMLFQLGRWNRLNYLMCTYLYDPLRAFQHEVVVRLCDLVLFKGERLVEDYGRGRSSVRGMWDPGFHAEHIIGERELEEKIERLEDPSAPLELAFFGRYVYYKGVDRCIEAVARAGEGGGPRIRLNLMGKGEEEPRLRQLVRELDLDSVVQFHDPVRYGPEFFARIRPWHLMLAAPLSVDTPRSTWDAIASGLPLLAFDTRFYEGLARATGVIDVVPWPSTEALAKRIRYYAENRSALAPLVRKTLEVARGNTQEQWLDRRVQWTQELFEGPG